MMIVFPVDLPRGDMIPVGPLLWVVITEDEITAVVPLLLIDMNAIIEALLVHHLCVPLLIVMIIVITEVDMEEDMSQ